MTKPRRYRRSILEREVYRPEIQIIEAVPEEEEADEVEEEDDNEFYENIISYVAYTLGAIAAIVLTPLLYFFTSMKSEYHPKMMVETCFVEFHLQLIYTQNPVSFLPLPVSGPSLIQTTLPRFQLYTKMVKTLDTQYHLRRLQFHVDPIIILSLVYFYSMVLVHSALDIQPAFRLQNDDGKTHTTLRRIQFALLDLIAFLKVCFLAFYYSLLAKLFITWFITVC